MTSPCAGAAGLPAAIGVDAFDALHDDPRRWRAAVAAIVGRDAAGIEPVGDGTALVAVVPHAAGDRIVKVYPPFLRDHADYERAVLGRLHRRLRVPTPEPIDAGAVRGRDGADGAAEAAGDAGGWPWLLMSRLPGTPLSRAWPALDEPARRRLLAEIGRLAAEVHAQPAGGLQPPAPAWADFVDRQRRGCRERQRRTGLPRHLLDRVDAFVAGELPGGPDAILTGEYTPTNLLVDDSGALSGMFDFGDGLVGPPAYDLLGPLCFLAAGDAARCDALAAGFGDPNWRDRRLPLLRLLLLHRYSHLRAQIALPGWQRARSFEALAAAIWP